MAKRESRIRLVTMDVSAADVEFWRDDNLGPNLALKLRVLGLSRRNRVQKALINDIG